MAPSWSYNAWPLGHWSSGCRSETSLSHLTGPQNHHTCESHHQKLIGILKVCKLNSLEIKTSICFIVKFYIYQIECNPPPPPTDLSFINFLSTFIPFWLVGLLFFDFPLIFGVVCSDWFTEISVYIRIL